MKYTDRIKQLSFTKVHIFLIVCLPISLLIGSLIINLNLPMLSHHISNQERKQRQRRYPKRRPLFEIKQRMRLFAGVQGVVFESHVFVCIKPFHRYLFSYIF